MLDDSEVRLALARIRGINFAICELGRQIKTNASCVKSRNSDGSDGSKQKLPRHSAAAANLSTVFRSDALQSLAGGVAGLCLAPKLP